jgi:hypothetical protein
MTRYGSKKLDALADALIAREYAAMVRGFLCGARTAPEFAARFRAAFLDDDRAMGPVLVGTLDALLALVDTEVPQAGLEEDAGDDAGYDAEVEDTVRLEAEQHLDVLEELVRGTTALEAPVGIARRRLSEPPRVQGRHPVFVERQPRIPPFVEHLRKVAAAASSAPEDGAWHDTQVKCSRRPGRRPCTGRMQVQRVMEERALHYQCSACEKNGGVITDWKGSEWDLSRALADEPGSLH